MISQLPKKLQEAIEHYTHEAKELIQARIDLTERYRKFPAKGPYMATEQHRLAYLSARLPATYAAVQAVMQNICQRMPSFSPCSLLDLGAGPGTALWGACDAFPSIEQAQLIERDEQLAAWGKRLATHADQAAIRDGVWHVEDLEKVPSFPSADLIIFSYSIGELKPSSHFAIIDKSWKAANQLLVVIEPGTPAGFDRIRLIRQYLIDQGAHLVAPCPHHLACPMPKEDWCHFSIRVERNALHRRLKEGSLPYEDEKYSYVVAAKTACPLPSARILRHPQHRSGHSLFTLCTQEGIKPITISKRQENYKAAKKWEWGESI